MVSFWKVSKTWVFFFLFWWWFVSSIETSSTLFFCYYKLHLGNLHMSQHKKWLHLRWFMSIDLKPFRTLGVWIRREKINTLHTLKYMANPPSISRLFIKSLFHFPNFSSNPYISLISFPDFFYLVQVCWWSRHKKPKVLPSY